MKKRILTISLIVGIVLTLVLCGTVISYMFRQTVFVDNKFVPAEVSCYVHEEFNGVEKTSIKVQNTGNIDTYIRVRIVTYWEDAEGNIVAKPSEPITFEVSDKWIKGSNDTYYYKEPVKPGESYKTDNLFKSGASLVLAQEGDYYQVVEVFAEAIQSKPAKAATSSWGVDIDEDNGNITTAP